MVGNEPIYAMKLSKETTESKTEDYLKTKKVQEFPTEKSREFKSPEIEREKDKSPKSEEIKIGSQSDKSENGLEIKAEEKSPPGAISLTNFSIKEDITKRVVLVPELQPKKTESVFIEWSREEPNGLFRIYPKLKDEIRNGLKQDPNQSIRDIVGNYLLENSEPNESNIDLPSRISTLLEEIIELDLSGLGLTSLSEDGFLGLNNLQELHLYNNCLTTLPGNIFKRLPNIKKICLSFNELTTLPENLFQNSNKLTELRMSFNNLNTLPRNIFQGLTNLQVIDLGINCFSLTGEEFRNQYNLGNNVRIRISNRYDY